MIPQYFGYVFVCSLSESDEGELRTLSKKKNKTRVPSTGQGSELHTKLCFSRLNAKEQIQSTRVEQH